MYTATRSYLPALVLLAALTCVACESKLPTTQDIQRAAEEFEPIKEARESYQQDIENRAAAAEDINLRGDVPSRTRTTSGEWLGPASKDPESGWKTSKDQKQSGWRGPGVE